MATAFLTASTVTIAHPRRVQTLARRTQPQLAFRQPALRAGRLQRADAGAEAAGSAATRFISQSKRR